MEVKVSLIDPNAWKVARKVARKTVGKEDLNKEVSDQFKLKSCISEHSHIREVRFMIEFESIPVTTSQQFTRHRIATNSGDFLHETINPADVEHYVTSQRPDRTGKERGILTDYICTSNIQGLIDMSKKRLCFNAEPTARKLWEQVKEQISILDPAVASVLVPSCVYRGLCPEIEKCRYAESANFDGLRFSYTSLIQ